MVDSFGTWSGLLKSSMMWVFCAASEEVLDEHGLVRVRNVVLTSATSSGGCCVPAQNVARRVRTRIKVCILIGNASNSKRGE